MPDDSVKARLLQATVDLLATAGRPDKLTARLIATEAGANLAMINYYFGSKDALLSAAVDRLMADRAAELTTIKDRKAPPRTRLLDFLMALSDMAVDHADLTRPTIPFLLLEGEIDLPRHILPMVRECRGTAATEAECRAIAYQLISFTQLVFYRSADFLAYSGIDVGVRAQRRELFTTMLHRIDD